MLNQIIYFILTNVPLIMCALAIIIAAMNPIYFNRNLFGYMLFFAVGISGIWGFIMHTFFSQISSRYIGWQPSPFEFEVGLANLGLGIAGIIAAFANWSYRAAIVTINTIFLWGAAAGHIYQIIFYNNFNLGNAGLILWTDILIPLILLILLIVTYKKKPQDLIYF